MPEKQIELTAPAGEPLAQTGNPWISARAGDPGQARRALEAGGRP